MADVEAPQREHVGLLGRRRGRGGVDAQQLRVGGRRAREARAGGRGRGGGGAAGAGAAAGAAGGRAVEGSQRDQPRQRGRVCVGHFVLLRRAAAAAAGGAIAGAVFVAAVAGRRRRRAEQHDRAVAVRHHHQRRRVDGAVRRRPVGRAAAPLMAMRVAGPARPPRARRRGAAPPAAMRRGRRLANATATRRRARPPHDRGLQPRPQPHDDKVLPGVDGEPQRAAVRRNRRRVEAQPPVRRSRLQAARRVDRDLEQQLARGGGGGGLGAVADAAAAAGRGGGGRVGVGVRGGRRLGGRAREAAQRVRPEQQQRRLRARERLGRLEAAAQDRRGAREAALDFGVVAAGRLFVRRATARKAALCLLLLVATLPLHC